MKARTGRGAESILSSSDLYLEITGTGPLTPELVAEVEALSDRAEDARAGAIAVIKATGSAGRMWPGDVGIHLVNKWERALRRLERVGVATVGVVTGECGGPAAEVLLSTDYRIATPDLMLSLPALGGQLWPGMVLHRLGNQVGVAGVRHLALFGSAISAADAVRLSLVDDVVDDVANGLTVAQGLLGDSAGTEFAIRRRLLLDAPTTSFEEALGTHLAACDRALRRSQENATTS
ncbi:MAG: enoyl-CoA-hydratase DpgB [Umezawaea sp.]